MTFAMRCVFGPHKGQYYSGFDQMSPKWTSNRADAELQSGSDAAGITMAMIGDVCTVVVPEKMESTSDDDCVQFADWMARGSWQSPSNELKEMIQKVIRHNEISPIHDYPSTMPPFPENKNGYMSVWEWMARAMVATQGE